MAPRKKASQANMSSKTTANSRKQVSSVATNRFEFADQVHPDEDQSSTKIQLESPKDLLYLKSEVLSFMLKNLNELPKKTEDEPEKEASTVDKQRRTTFATPPVIDSDITKFVDGLFDKFKLNVRVAGVDWSDSLLQEHLQIDEGINLQNIYYYVIVDQELVKRMEQEDAKTRALMQELNELRSRVPALVNSLNSAKNEFIDLSTSSVMDEQVNNSNSVPCWINQQVQTDLNSALSIFEELQSTMPKVLAKLERAKTVIEDEEARRSLLQASQPVIISNISTNTPAQPPLTPSTTRRFSVAPQSANRQRRVSRQFEIASKMIAMS